MNRPNETALPTIAPIDGAQRTRIDEALRSWRQGDCVLGDHAFLFRLSLHAPISETAATAATRGADVAETQVSGFAIVTQTCDIVRSCQSRPFVQVCPLVQVEPDKLVEIQRGRRPSYAFVPGVARQGLVLDLDRVMTVEKAVVADWNRIDGAPEDKDAQLLRMALMRNRGRVAFPDDFVQLAAGLTRRISKKHNARSDEGRALQALQEIRVRVEPSWQADEASIMFLFIRDDEAPTFDGKEWKSRMEQWLERTRPAGRFTRVDGLVLTLDTITGREYVESDPLDLDHLSMSGT